MAHKHSRSLHAVKQYVMYRNIFSSPDVIMPRFLSPPHFLIKFYNSWQDAIINCCNKLLLHHLQNMGVAFVWKEDIHLMRNVIKYLCFKCVGSFCSWMKTTETVCMKSRLRGNGLNGETSGSTSNYPAIRSVEMKLYEWGDTFDPRLRPYNSYCTSS